MSIIRHGSPTCWGFSRLLRWGFMVFFCTSRARRTQTNNIPRVAFGVLFVGLRSVRTMIIMAHLKPQHEPMDRLIKMQSLALQRKPSPAAMAIRPDDALCNRTVPVRVARISFDTKPKVSLLNRVHSHRRDAFWPSHGMVTAAGVGVGTLGIAMRRGSAARSSHPDRRHRSTAGAHRAAAGLSRRGVCDESGACCRGSVLGLG